ncbi:putative bifunctional diguanylate cyclase/phosphodiesterase [Aurantiacibacter sp. 219JJ12-13]|nr:GGDEF and EAL domain-containing protein [Aurantiacibacter sp. 219JJ12-13]MDP5262483.1 EAL domain-containing protein [Aurantiacibacter sp. 219JJ12-13]
MSILQVIGLRDPSEGDWTRLRTLQYAELHRVSLFRIAAHGLAALIAVTLYAGSIAPWILSAWLLSVVLAVWNVGRIDRRFVGIENRGVQWVEFSRQALGVAGCTVPWVAALLFFVPEGTAANHYALWALAAMLIAGSAAAATSAPVATVVFDLIVGAAGAASFILTGDILFAIAAIVYTITILAGALRSARMYLSARIAEAGVAEKDEVVSLLLREFEEKESDWLWQVDTNRRIRAASPRFAFAFGSMPEEIEGESFIKLIAGAAWESGEFPRTLHELAEKLKRREHFSNILVQVHLEAGRRWWELSGTPMYDENGSYIGFRGVGSDVTEQRDRDEKIAYLARYDTLTGLPNRLMLTEALGEAMRYADQWKTRCAFLMIDLDRFKAVNDSLGHQLGDRLLAKVSRRLDSVMGENEQCGRLGGDEFAVVIRDAADKSRVERLSEAIIDTLSQPYLIDNHTLFIGASVGSAIGPRDGDSVETLMRNADLALYRAKDEGGNTHYRYQPSLHADAEERRKLELSLRQAIRKGELELNFQPVVNARSECVVSFEALLRWNSSEHGFVSPAKFIPLAEDTRLIVPIGEWVLHEACREAVRWPDDIKVAVNVSGEQLLEPNFSASVVRALADTGLPAHRLEVEVTESVFLRDGRTARQTLEEIMALGCSIALDDFGTGYSSLGYLRTLRFSTIKVDKSFVQGAAQDNQESLAIIRAVVAMAQSLQMTTTAEGVEDEDQVALIRELGCTKIQGYYFGRPMKATEAHSLVIRTRNTRAA